MSTKNVLIIGNYPPPYGGVPHHIERLTEYLVARGWNCCVLSGGTSGTRRVKGTVVYSPTYVRKLGALIRRATDRRFEAWLGGSGLSREEHALWRRYKMYFDVGEQIARDHRVDLIASYNLLSYAPIGAMLARRHRVPHIISIFGEIYRFQSMLNSKTFFANVTNEAFRILSCSEHCGRSLSRLGIEKSVQAVTYGVNVQHFTPGDASDLRNSYGLGEGPIVLFVGRLGRELGLDSFLAAAKEVAQAHPSARFVMVGQNAELAQLAEAECASSAGRFVLVRNAPYSDLARYYRLADVVVVPSRGERTCSSLAAMEAMATRKPVVAFAIGGIPEIVKHEETGLLVDPEDQRGLAVAVLRVLEDRALADRLAQAGYIYSHQSCDERQVNIAMERHFLDALAAQ